MKILVLGAGQVGKTVAQALSHEGNEITIVDWHASLLKDLEHRMDIKTVLGHAAHPDVLMRASAEEAELFQTPTRLARVRAQSYQDHPELFTGEAVPVNHIINPELLVTNSIQHLIEHTEALQILDFADGKARLVAVRAHSGGPLIGQELRTLSRQVLKASTRIVAVFRRNQAIIPEGRTVVERGDEVFFLAASNDIPIVLKAFGRAEVPTRRVFIGGGGKIGKRLAEQIESHYFVKIIEQDMDRCQNLVRSLRRAIVLNGDVTDASLLREEGIMDADVYCAVTNDDETNILSSMLAKRCGVGKTLSLINHPDYLDLVQGEAVDIAISPALFSIGAILTHIRQGDVVAVHSLRRGAAEAIEIVVHGDKLTSGVVGQRAKGLPLPTGSSIGAIIRGEDLVFINSKTTIESGDHVILFLVDKRHIKEVEELFQVKSSYL
jgi:trk system potassium uptake protein TrkA